MAEKIRVLIVDDIAETRENIKRLLQFDASLELIGAARSGKEAIEMSQQLKPDVVIMDINMPDIDGITATELIRKKVPFTQIVILSVQSDSSYMRRALQAGARDFLTKPPMIDELNSAVKRAGILAQDERAKNILPFTTGSTQQSTPIQGSGQAGKIIVIYSPKGGTGCTTIATNLAIALHSEESRTVLVDASLQFGDLAVFLNEQVKNSIIDLTMRADELDSDVVEEVLIKNNSTGLRLLPAPPKPEMADQVTGEQLSKTLQFLQKIYAYVVVDTASYLTEVVQSALDVADLIILITTQDIPSIKSCSSFLALADSSGIKRERIMFIMNRFDKRIAISPERIGESLRQEVKIAIPFEERIVPLSINRGVPFIIDNKSHPIGKSILSLAGIVREKIAALESGEQIPAKK